MKKTFILLFMAFCLFTDYVSAQSNAVEKPKDFVVTVKGVSFKMIYVEGGTFMMGATQEQGDEAHDDEKPAHSVTLSDYFIGETEVTQELWQAVMRKNPSKFKGPRLPVEQVSWRDCQTFVRRLNALTGKKFRLPTEAEWEYAARGGQKSQGYMYAGSNTLGDVAWHDGGIKGGTHEVATKSPNELGIYDMSGNVYEWCKDWYGENYYSKSPKDNPQGPSKGSERLNRGGSWVDFAWLCRVSNRDCFTPNKGSFFLGLRLVL